jgi:hypothetical protein
MDLRVRIDCSTVNRDLPIGFRNTVKEKNCSSCGEGFTCGAQGREERCWCEHLPHLPLAAIETRDCLCPRCLSDAIKAALPVDCPVEECSQDWVSAAKPVGAVARTDMGQPRLLLEGEDYYSENGLIVFTAGYHRRRGYCCESSCRHCPFTD